MGDGGCGQGDFQSLWNIVYANQHKRLTKGWSSSLDIGSAIVASRIGGLIKIVGKEKAVSYPAQQ